MKLGISLIWDPSYSRHMHAYKIKVYIYNVTRTELWQNQPELHRLKCADPFSEGSKYSTALQMV
jgi:hypothetical protein